MRVVGKLVWATALLIGALASTHALGQAGAPAPPQQSVQTPATADAPPAGTASPAPSVQQPAAAAQAQAVVPPPPQLDVEPALKRLVEQIDGAEKTIPTIKDRDDALAKLRGVIEGAMFESTQTAEALRPRLADVKGQIDKLGPPPKADAQAEAPPVQAERGRLNALASALDGAIKTSELTWVRSRQLIERITDLRRSLFAQSIFQQLPSPLTPALWRDVLNDSPSVFNTLAYIGQSWWALAEPKIASVMAILIAAGVLYVVLRQSFRILAKARRRHRPAPPTFIERAAAITWFAPLRAMAPIFAVLVVYVGLDTLDILHFWADRVLWAIVKSVLIFSAIAAVVATVLSPSNADWRLVPLSDRSAAQLSRLMQAIAAMFSTDLALAEISRWLTLNVGFTVVETIVANLTISALTAGVLLTRFAAVDGSEARVPRLFPMWLKLPIWLIVLGIVGATLAGYIALGRFAAHQLVLTGVVIVVTGLLYLAIRAFTREPQNAGLPVGAILESTFGLDERHRQTLARLIELALTVLLVMLAVPFVLLQWGFAGADIRDWFRSIFFGFEIGQFKISIARIVISILLFVVLVLATRVVQRWIHDVMLVPARLEAGLVNSIDTVLGYIGTMLAALIAVSYAGFDITNLAIVAGALSVGIGFGLQSIVNNFVSGLILLFERPIKVGDWIVVGNDEGIVRKISVRSTEIETFDRSSVVVPNSELISGRVKNWTLRDAVGRQRITLSVRYDMDPEKARQLLLGLAKEHPNVLERPAPSVSFDTFGPDAATLTLQFFVADITRLAGVKTDLSFKILHLLPDSGIQLLPPAAAAAVAGAAQPQVGSTIRIPINIGFDADLDRAREVLEDSARTVAGVAEMPIPQVEFDAFTNDAVTLAVVASCRPAANPTSVRTDLALAVVKALRKAGIGSPAPQHSVKLADLEPLRQGLMQALEERRRTKMDA